METADPTPAETPGETTTADGLVIRRHAYDDPVAQAMVAQAQADLAARYGGPDETPVDPAEFLPPHGAFLVAYLDGEPVGCGGWRRYEEGTAELKRMFTTAAARRKGVARRVLAAVEESARAHGMRRMILECGERQPEAIALYRSAGYEPIPHYGFYKCAPEVVSLGRDL